MITQDVPEGSRRERITVPTERTGDTTHPGLDVRSNNLLEDLKKGAWLEPNPDLKACCGKKFILVGLEDGVEGEFEVVHQNAQQTLVRLGLVVEREQGKWTYNNPNSRDYVKPQELPNNEILTQQWQAEFKPTLNNLSVLEVDYVRARDIVMEEALKEFNLTNVNQATLFQRRQIARKMQPLLEKLVSALTLTRREGEQSGFAIAQAGMKEKE